MKILNGTPFSETKNDYGHNFFDAKREREKEKV